MKLRATSTVETAHGLILKLDFSRFCACFCIEESTPLFRPGHAAPGILVLELELIQTQMAQKPMLRAEVGMRVRCANKASAE